MANQDPQTKSNFELAFFQVPQHDQHASSRSPVCPARCLRHAVVDAVVPCPLSLVPCHLSLVPCPPRLPFGVSGPTSSRPARPTGAGASGRARGSTDRAYNGFDIINMTHSSIWPTRRPLLARLALSPRRAVTSSLHCAVTRVLWLSCAVAVCCGPCAVTASGSLHCAMTVL